MSEGIGPRFGILRVNRDLLRAALGLPEGTIIIEINDQRRFFEGDIEIHVQHPDLPLVQSGARIPEVGALIDKDRNFVRWVI